MTERTWFGAGALVVLAFALAPMAARGEILAMMNYESKSPESLKAMKAPMAPSQRREGIAIIDIDPASPNHGKIMRDIPLPADLVAHHIFYNKDLSKAYVTALGQSALHVIDMAKEALPIVRVDIPGCSVLEDVVFSGDNKTWYVSCMGTQNVVVGDAIADKPLRNIALPVPYPHGVAINEKIDRLIATSTVRASDLGDAGEAISVVELSTGKALGAIKVSNKPSPAGEAPVEILFVPGANPPAAYVTNMYGGTLWLLSWKDATKSFEPRQVFDFATLKSGVPLEIYFNAKGDRLYVTTAKPGHLHIFDISGGAESPKLMKSIPAAEGAHHVSITPDERYAFVQNALLNLPGMSDGSVTVIDLVKGEPIGSVDTLKEKGLNPNSIVLLPRWYHAMGH
ncbi:MAG: YncE family protein [Proteobacteria bacterium]|nr:YncE family protein [Pseudomonadota bacterium]